LSEKKQLENKTEQEKVTLATQKQARADIAAAVKNYSILAMDASQMDSFDEQA